MKPLPKYLKPERAKHLGPISIRYGFDLQQVLQVWVAEYDWCKGAWQKTEEILSREKLKALQSSKSMYISVKTINKAGMHKEYVTGFYSLNIWPYLRKTEKIIYRKPKTKKR